MCSSSTFRRQLLEVTEVQRSLGPLIKGTGLLFPPQASKECGFSLVVVPNNEQSQGSVQAVTVQSTRRAKCTYTYVHVHAGIGLKAICSLGSCGS